jgi:hypothetical protein
VEKESVKEGAFLNQTTTLEEQNEKYMSNNNKCKEQNVFITTIVFLLLIKSQTFPLALPDTLPA